ncbi:MAG: dicarboxylate/amino acid:cation symporter, partial [Verrucomicrobia bacterium]|nr:dicarboxylate/amino acid:cation symporter [Verrucomicrobiota bacterium]
MLWNALRRISLTQWILISMVLGIFIGWAFPETTPAGDPAYPELARNLKVISKLFLNLIKCIIVPILVGTLIIGIAGHSDDLKAVGRLAFKSFIYFEVVTTAALFIGLAAVNLTKPGVGVLLPPSADTGKEFAAKTQTTQEMIEHIAPKSFFESAANNDVLQVVVFTILFALALAQVKGKPKETMLNFFEGLSEVMFKFTGLVMMCAPFGIGAAMAVTVGHSGLAVLKNLGMLVLTLYGALVVFCLVVLVPIALWARIPLLKFLRAVKEPALIAFS